MAVQRTGMSIRRSVMVTSLVMALGMITAACQEAETPKTGTTGTTATTTASTENPKELKLGSLLPSTGDLASLGGPMIESVPLLVETVNQCGGVNGQPVSLVASDDQTDATAGTEAVTRLVNVEKVAGVVGSFASGVSMAGAAVTSRNKVMMISPGSTSPELTKKSKEFNGYWARSEERRVGKECDIPC